MAESHITGRALIKINGETKRSRPGSTLNMGGFANTTINGDDSVHGFTQAVTAPKIECTLTHDKSFSIKEINDITDASIIFECDNGKSYIISNAWRSGDPVTLKSDDGSVACTFEGISCEEL